MKSGLFPEKLLNKAAELFQSGTTGHLPELPHSAEALLVLAMNMVHKSVILWVSDGQGSLELMHRDLLTLGQGRQAELLFFPPAEHDSKGKVDPDISGQRLDVLLKIAELSNDLPEDHANKYIITTTIQALMQKGLTPQILARLTAVVEAGKEYDIEDLIDQISASGYVFQPEVQEKCSAAMKGGLLDVWPPTETWPVRIEF